MYSHSQLLFFIVVTSRDDFTDFVAARPHTFRRRTMMALLLTAQSFALPVATVAPHNVTKSIPVHAPPTSDERFTSACAYLSPFLDPSMCGCTDTSTLGASVVCTVDIVVPGLPPLDTIGVKMNFEPCAQPMHMDLEVTEAAIPLDVPIADISAGDAQYLPVPGRALLAARTRPRRASVPS